MPSAEAAAGTANQGQGALFTGVDRGAAVFVVETLVGAKKRGTAVLAELADCEESFDPVAAPLRHPGCLCLVKAVKKVQKNSSPLDYRARGLWGGRIRLSLKPRPH